MNAMNENQILLCQTQNDAVFLSRTLMRCGVSGQIVKPPRRKTGRSCAWGVQIAAEYRQKAEQCLRGLSLSWRWMD